MFEDLDPRSPVPLYEQIAARIRVAVAAEEFTPGELLPSVRSLAGTLRVNPATVVQAYRDLEREGFVEMRHGAGTYVQAVPAKKRQDERARQARKIVRDMLAEGARVGLGATDLMRALEVEMNGGGDD
ncbi:MAG TPA: GntR family transcriptional regulator [Longimicrobiales bacterium]|nr:GntR family transcriptional regulator [Longimicrobiales bacterium]